MNASQSTSATGLDPLESLRSPHVNQTSLPSERDSIAGSEFNDIALDDDSYCPVTTQPQIPESYPQRQDDLNAAGSQSSVASLSVTPRDLLIPVKSHRKTVSTTTIRSSHERNGSVPVARLDFQEHSEKVARASVDGQMKLQEEFARLQEKETKDHNQTESNIDWGECQSPLQSTYHLTLPRILGRGYIWYVPIWNGPISRINSRQPRLSWIRF